jgi:flagellar basal body rod protein FlgG
MIASEQWLDVVANNLANASTTAYKRDEATFNEGLLRIMNSNNGRGGQLGELGAGPKLIATHTIWENGSLLATGNPLDVGIRGEGLFGIQTSQGVRYTRAGSFTLNNLGELVTQSGDRVLDQGGAPIAIPLDEGRPEITDSGKVMLAGEEIATLGVFTGQPAKIGGSLYTLQNPRLVESPNLVAGSLESSNVNPVQEMIAMIKLHRVFEMAQKSATTQDEATSGLIQSIGKP